LIQSVSVERVLPHTLRIRVTEREPLAQVCVLKPASSGGIERAIFQLDAEGSVIVPLEPRQRTIPPNQALDPLPLIQGVNPNEIQAGRRIELRQVRAALDLLVAFERSPMQGSVEVKSIDIASPEVLIVTTTQGSQITFGLVDLDRQLRRWRSVFTLGQQSNKAIANLDLAVTNSIPVVFQDAALLPPSSPRPVKQLKRKHV
jgi:cell division septal protein FtsQ